jgi:hypothetical protein
LVSDDKDAIRRGELRICAEIGARSGDLIVRLLAEAIDKTALLSTLSS